MQSAVIAFLALVVLVSTTNAATPVRKSSDVVPASDNVKVIVKYKQGIVTAQGVSGSGDTRIFNVKTDEAEAFSAQLRLRPEVENVALDYVVRNPLLPVQPELLPPLIRAAGEVPGSTPTDPDFNLQTSWRAPTESAAGVQNLLAGYIASERSQKMRIGVLDSGFYPVSDMVYTSGYNFSEFTESEERGPQFLENEIRPGCTSPHGTAVSGIVAATTDNGIGTAGILDTELVAARVLSCDSGLLSDTALGIRWLAGDPSVVEAPPLDRPVNIINASLGTSANSCPFYLQEAIDYAYNRGILVVVAAGNSNADAEGYAPANCRHVVTVGSVGENGIPSYFSNYGDNVILAALGERVAAINSDGRVSLWSGTSFAAPLVTGAAGLLKQANPALTPDQLRNELIATARPLVVPQLASMEDPKFFGGGIVDAGKSVENVAAVLDALRPDIRPALDAMERCNRQAYLENAPIGVDYNRVYEVTAPAELAAESELYFVFRTSATGEKEVLHQGSERKFVLKDVDPQSEQLWFDMCDSDNKNCRFDRKLPL